MITIVLLFTTLWTISQSTVEEFYKPYNVTRTTLSDIAMYRSALTLDWLAAEDNRQRELARAFETEATPPLKIFASDCVSYEKPSPGKVARLMLELLKNLEGDEAVVIPDLIQALVRARLLVETSVLEAEPDLDSLVKTPAVMMGEPHATFPRVLALAWIAATDPATTRKNGWCSVAKITKYLAASSPTAIAKNLRDLDPLIARARFIMEEFIQHVTPNMYDRKNYFEKEEMKAAKLKDVKHVVTRQSGRYGTPTRTPPTQSEKIISHSQSTPAQETRSNWRRSDQSILDSRKTLQTECPRICSHEDFEPDFGEDRWHFRRSKTTTTVREVDELRCSVLRPTAKDVIRRFYAILPYFDKDHSNTAFLHKFRATVHGMSVVDDKLDTEVSFYASLITPLVFLQQYRDTWCLLERFHRAMRLYQISHPSDKRSALKILQNLRAVNQQIGAFIKDLPGGEHVSRTTLQQEPDYEELHDKKDVRYLKELIKSLG